MGGERESGNALTNVDSRIDKDAGGLLDMIISNPISVKMGEEVVSTNSRPRPGRKSSTQEVGSSTPKGDRSARILPSVDAG